MIFLRNQAVNGEKKAKKNFAGNNGDSILGHF